MHYPTIAWRWPLIYAIYNKGSDIQGKVPAPKTHFTCMCIHIACDHLFLFSILLSSQDPSGLSIPEELRTYLTRSTSSKMSIERILTLPIVSWLCHKTWKGILPSKLANNSYRATDWTLDQTFHCKHSSTVFPCQDLSPNCKIKSQTILLKWRN